MKITVLKRIFTLLIMLGLVGVLVTSCEREVIYDESKGVRQVDIQQNESLVKVSNVELEDLPFEISNPDDVLKSTQIENEDITLRGCDFGGCWQKVRSLTCNTVKWTSNPQYALWLVHYDSSGNYISTTRKDVPYCGTWLKSYTYPSNRRFTEAFVGYRSCGKLKRTCW